MQAEVDALVFKPQRQPLVSAGSDFLPRRQLSHQTTQPVLVRPRPEGLIDKDTESHFVRGGNTLRVDADAGHSFDAVYSGHEGEVQL